MLFLSNLEYSKYLPWSILIVLCFLKLKPVNYTASKTNMPFFWFSVMHMTSWGRRRISFVLSFFKRSRFSVAMEGWIAITSDHTCSNCSLSVGAATEQHGAGAFTTLPSQGLNSKQENTYSMSSSSKDTDNLIFFLIPFEPLHFPLACSKDTCTGERAPQTYSILSLPVCA